ncbi:MAG: UvrABC system protein C [Candidatus Hepatoplasma vulgare]|nr:MAG: UvrABC system protein C [Candidatus Hepatoplasma sp.]
MINLSNVPNKPGCYLWKDESGEIIYVGKAKKLRNRMKQYFNLNQNPKTKMLVKHISDFEYVLVPSEIDALLVELNLINKYSPKYNIKLKETKTYPYLLFKKEPTLKLEITKNIKNKKLGQYFGPFPEGFGPKKIKKLVESIYPIGKCLNPNSGKPCLNYQLGLCPGYCLGEVSKEKINSIFNDVKKLLTGDVNDAIKKVNEKIEEFSNHKMFEQAQELYDKIPLLKNYSEKQHSYFKDNKHRDIVTYVHNDDFISIAISHIRFGKLINTSKFLLKVFEENYEEVFLQHIVNYYQKNLLPNELIVEKNLELENFLKVKVIIPEKGIKKDLLILAREQAIIKLNAEKEELLLKIERREKAIKDLKETLKLKNIKEIELVDISHFQGKNQIGVVVNFNEFLPDKDKYRKYNLDEENDDYRHIYEVTYRHFRRKIMYKIKTPNLFIVDGKAQIKYAKKALDELNIKGITLIGLIKDKKHNTSGIITIENKKISLNQKNDLYILLGFMQDEVHRFAIKSFREKNKKLIK